VAFFIAETMGGGPQMRTFTSLAGAGKCSCFQPLAEDHPMGERLPYLDHFGCDKANASTPALRWIVKNVVHPELGILLDKLVQILSQQDVLGVDIGKDEVDFSGITKLASTDDGTDDLQHGRDASATSDHAKSANHVGSVHHGTLGALDLHRLSNLEAGHVFGDVAGWV
jgi:hypothetical protein